MACRITGQLVSSAGVRPFLSRTVVSTPNSSMTLTHSRCFLKAAKCSGYCCLEFGTFMQAMPGADSRVRSTSTWPIRHARETAEFCRKPSALASTFAYSNNSTASFCPALAAHTSGVFPLSSGALRPSNDGTAFNAVRSPATAAIAAGVPGTGGSNFFSAGIGEPSTAIILASGRTCLLNSRARRIRWALTAAPRRGKSA
mmetsp:Transcript_32552/g.86007  ORF Transcript_32552/g.86007 Transcript_32552/m.86007 type:complete len:200 (+) Transcript_32552:161-760(+)